MAACTPTQNICQNGGFCVILFGRDITCTCSFGYTGIIIYINIKYAFDRYLKYFYKSLKGQYCEINQNGIVASITTSTTTVNPTIIGSSSVPSIAACTASQNICRNGGYCVILFGRDVTCTCPIGYTGTS